MTARTLARRTLATLAAGAAMVSIAACGGDDGGSRSSGDFSVARALGQLPRSALEDKFMLTVSDLDQASELAGAPRPNPNADFDATFEWVKQLDGVFQSDGGEWPLVAVLFPEAVNIRYLQQFEEFRDEMGWSLLDVRSFAEISIPPARFTVMDGTFDADRLDRALGDRSDDGVWSIGGEDFSVDLPGRTAARPLGEALRLSEREGQLAVSKSTPPIEDWLQRDDDRVDEIDDLLAVAEALDDHDVYTAMLVDPEALAFQAPLRSTPEQVEQLAGQLLDEYEAFGAGLTVVDGEPVGVLVYEFSRAAKAADNAALLEEIFDDGMSIQASRPLAELFPDAEVTVDDTTVIVTTHFREGRAVVLWSAIYAVETFLAHG